jgi:hypothetical protein
MLRPASQKIKPAMGERAQPAQSTGHDDGKTLAFAQLLKLESEARRAKTTRELDALQVNDCRKLLRARQVFIVESGAAAAKVVAMSGFATIDRAAPIVAWLERLVVRMAKDTGLAKRVEFSLPGYADPSDPLTRDYPFRAVLWQPMWQPDGQVSAGTLYLRETPWLDADRTIAARLGETFGHSRALLTAQVRHRYRLPINAKSAGVVAAILAAASLIPVPMSVLAPLEVVPRNADVIAMPTDGIVQKILIQPNATVLAGTPLVKLVDTIPRNKAELAIREVAVAEARVEKATSLAFTDPRGRQELGIARAELSLKLAERSFAQDILAQTIIKAERAGVAIFSDPKEMEGKPFPTGERLMLIAREGDAELKLALPIADSIVLRPGLRVKAFLDADPLSAAEAEIVHVDYQARVDEMQTATYRVTANLRNGGAPLKLGSRGTAQIIGEKAPILLYVFRRPLTALRQWIGL